jgi:hypothetical protein
MTTTMKDLGFEFLRTGIWVNDAKGVCVVLDEDYKRTYRAFTAPRPFSQYVVTNKSGNEIRFRSKEAAAAYVIERTPDGAVNDGLIIIYDASNGRD